MKYTLVVPLAPERDAPILACIKKLDYPKNKFHVVVVRGKNPSLNRNKAIERAKGEYVVFLDDDAIIKEDYLKKIDEFLEKHSEIDVVGGPQLTPDDDNWFAKISGYAFSSRFGAWTLRNRYDLKHENLDADETALTSANLVCKKKVVEKIKFDETLFPGEDPKFIEDVKKAGFRVAYTPSFVLYHKRRPTFRLLVKQIFNYGKVRPQKESFFQTVQKPFFLVPSLFVLYLLIVVGSLLYDPSFVGSGFSFENDFETVRTGTITALTGNVIAIPKIFGMGFLFTLPLKIYMLLMFLFGLRDAGKHRNVKAVFILPFLYPVIHVSYGIGMLWGYVRKLWE